MVSVSRRPKFIRSEYQVAYCSIKLITVYASYAYFFLMKNYFIQFISFRFHKQRDTMKIIFVEIYIVIPMQDVYIFLENFFY